MRRIRGLLSAVAVAATASTSAGAGPPAPALRVAPDSSRSDSTAASTNPDSTPGSAVRIGAKLSLSVGDSLASIETRLAELDSSRAGLSEKDRRVFDELVAASRELYEAGDVEAARLAIDDALLFVQGRPR